jgi:putative ABC transport system permease protein
VIRYAWLDLIRNSRRTLASMLGVALGIGLFASVLFFIDGSAATMTERAIAPVTLDMQWIVTTDPNDLTIVERVSGAALETGERTTVTLDVTNGASAPANDVVVHDEPPTPLRYVDGTTTLDLTPVPDIDGDSPLSHGIAGFGMSVGRIPAGSSVSITYDAVARDAVQDAASLPIRATVSSREQQVPIRANAGPVLTLDELSDRIGALPGVAAADELTTVDLPPGALSAGGAAASGPVRVFALDEGYVRSHPSITLVSGAIEPDGALLSVEASRSLEIAAGETIDVDIPGRGRLLQLPVTGVTDLAQAQALFASRKASELEEFLYVPNDVVVSPTTFRDAIAPAMARAAASVGAVVKSFPVSEVDVQVDRSPLDADPGAALRQTSEVARSIEAAAPDQGYLIDNISNALSVATVDASTGRRMFLFLGLPGALLAAFLAAFAGSILAATERRERATLRIRGATRAHLRAIALTKAVAIALGGSIVGIALGLASSAAILGTNALFAASFRSLAASAAVAILGGLVVTAAALYVPAHRSIGREVNEQRRALASTTSPTWRRVGLDIVLVVMAVAVEIAAIRTGALEPPAGSVYEGLAVSLPTGLLPAPLLLWAGACLLGVRAALAIVRRAPVRDVWSRVVPSIVVRSLRRRAVELASGLIGVGLVGAFATSLSLVAATYDDAKAADVRFALGSDVRITPSVLAAPRPSAADAPSLMVPGVTAVSPVVFGLENAVVIGPHDQQREHLGAIDPDTFPQVAPLPDEVFIDATAADTIAALRSRPDGMLLAEEAADDLSLDVGDRAEVILALGTRRETHERFRVAGLFERFPGMPEGADVIVRLDRYATSTQSEPVDFFLASVEDRSSDGLAAAASALMSGPGAGTPLLVTSTDQALAKDASSLTAVNVTGLVRLNIAYALAMSATAIGIFVFGLMVQRRSEYVTLRAYGLRTSELRAFVLSESFVVAGCGLLIGLAVGALTAALQVSVLRGIFVLTPQLTPSPNAIATLCVAVLGAGVVCALAATRLLGRLDPAEILREE